MSNTYRMFSTAALRHVNRVTERELMEAFSSGRKLGRAEDGKLEILAGTANEIEARRAAAPLETAVIAWHMTVGC